MQWYHRLLGEGNLYESVAVDPRGVIVQWESPAGRRFGYFPDVDQARGALLLTPPEERCFYEIIPGTRPQKPHFDIDLPSSAGIEGLEMLALFLERLAVTMAQLNQHFSPHSDVLVFDSSGAGKYSYHVVLPRHHHSNNREARAFYDLVVAGMPAERSCYVDRAVYSGQQNFRLVGCHKAGSTRTKLWRPRLEFAGMVVQCHCSDVFTASLVGHISQNSTLLELETKVTAPREIELDDNEHAEVLRLIGEWCPHERIRSANGTLFVLERVSPGFCKPCQREHHHENPFVVYNPDHGSLLKYCRRNEHPELLGYIAPVLPELLQQDPVDLDDEFTLVAETPPPSAEKTKNMMDRASMVLLDVDEPPRVRRPSSLHRSINTVLLDCETPPRSASHGRLTRKQAALRASLGDVLMKL